MQINSTTQTKAPAATIPAHVLERLEKTEKGSSGNGGA